MTQPQRKRQRNTHEDESENLQVISIYLQNEYDKAYRIGQAMLAAGSDLWSIVIYQRTAYRLAILKDQTNRGRHYKGRF